MIKEQFVREQLRIFLIKNHDYGDSFKDMLRKYGDIVYIIMAEVKLHRISQLKEKSNLVESEPLEDSYRDLYNYTAMYLWEKHNKSEDIKHLVNTMQVMLISTVELAEDLYNVTNLEDLPSITVFYEIEDAIQELKELLETKEDSTGS